MRNRVAALPPHYRIYLTSRGELNALLIVRRDIYLVFLKEKSPLPPPPLSTQPDRGIVRRVRRKYSRARVYRAGDWSNACERDRVNRFLFHVGTSKMVKQRINPS